MKKMCHKFYRCLMANIRRARKRHRQPASTNYDKYDCIHICERHSYHNLSCKPILCFFNYTNLFLKS
uniref:Uncharacterized protein n=1 Tax=Trichogramma kaykai TaxID=54128 RepID=A0ABD2X6L3_9HYME